MAKSIEDKISHEMKEVKDYCHEFQKNHKTEHRLLEQLQQQLKEEQKQRKRIYNDRQKLLQTIEDLREKVAFSEATNEMRSSRKFEKLIFTDLHKRRNIKEGKWIVLSEFDVHPNSKKEKFTDLLLIGSSFVMVIEAKNYGGTIYSEGDPKNSYWFSRGQKTGEPKEIRSCYGTNPYHQAKAYKNGIMSRLAEEIRANRIGVYTAIIFPNNADIRNLGETMSPWIHVGTVNSLGEIARKCEKESKQFVAAHGSIQRSAQDIRNLLLRRPVKLQKTERC